MSDSLFLNTSSDRSEEPQPSFLFSTLRRLKFGTQTMSATNIVGDTSMGTQGAHQGLGHDEPFKDPYPLAHHSGELPQTPSLVDQERLQQPPSPDHITSRPEQIPITAGLRRTLDSGYHSERESQVAQQHQLLPHSSFVSPVATSTMSVYVSFPASAPTTSVSFSSHQQHGARHAPRAASASAAVLSSSTLPESGVEEPKQHPKIPTGGTLSRHTLQRTRTTGMLLSPTLTLSRPSSVVLPPLPSITLKPPPVCSSI